MQLLAANDFSAITSAQVFFCMRARDGASRHPTTRCLIYPSATAQADKHRPTIDHSAIPLIPS